MDLTGPRNDMERVKGVEGEGWGDMNHFRKKRKVGACDMDSFPNLLPSPIPALFLKMLKNLKTGHLYSALS